MARKLSMPFGSTFWVAMQAVARKGVARAILLPGEKPDADEKPVDLTGATLAFVVKGAKETDGTATVVHAQEGRFTVIGTLSMLPIGDHAFALTSTVGKATTTLESGTLTVQGA